MNLGMSSKSDSPSVHSTYLHLGGYKLHKLILSTAKPEVIFSFYCCPTNLFGKVLITISGGLSHFPIKIIIPTY